MAAVSRYRRLADELRDAILAGRYPQGTKLPTEVNLVSTHGISRQTVRQAFAQLVAEGLVYRVRGRGTFAMPRRVGPYVRSAGSIDDLLALSLDTQLEVVLAAVRCSDIEAAGRLQAPADEVFRLVTRRLHEGLPFEVSLVSVPLSVGRAAGVDKLTSTGFKTSRTIIGLIDQSDAGPIAGAQQSATVAVVPPDLAPMIDCEPGRPVLRVDRLYYNRSGDPVELAINHFNPDRYSYRLELRR